MIPGVHAFGVAVDSVAGKVYWSLHHGHKIQRANLDGSQIEDVVLTGLHPSALALDATTGKLYWVDQGNGGIWDTIRRVNVDGTGVEDVAQTLNGQQIALELAEGKIYWADRASGLIRRADIGGSTVEDLITDTTLPQGLALDFEARKMYWTSGDRIERSDLDGRNSETILRLEGSDPHHLVLVPVPEPASAALVLVCLFLIIVACRLRLIGARSKRDLQCRFDCG